LVNKWATFHGNKFGLSENIAKSLVWGYFFDSTLYIHRFSAAVIVMSCFAPSNDAVSGDDLVIIAA